MAAAYGLLIASLGKTPNAARGASIFATLIMVMLGGAWVPTFVFPEWLQHLTVVVPTRWAVDGFDAMTWRGLGLRERGDADRRPARIRGAVHDGRGVALSLGGGVRITGSRGRTCGAGGPSQRGLHDHRRRDRAAAVGMDARRADERAARPAASVGHLGQRETCSHSARRI